MKYSMLFILILMGCGGAPQRATDVVDQRVSTSVTPLDYTVTLELDPSRAEYGGRVQILVKVHASVPHIRLHSKDHDISSASLAGGAGQDVSLIPSRRGIDWLILTPEQPIIAGEYLLSIDFKGRMNNPLFGLYRTQQAGDWYIYSQFEALGAREAFPCFDEPQFKTPYAIGVIIPDGLNAFGNAPEAKRKKTMDGRLAVNFKKTPPLPSYLVALAIGPIDIAGSPETDLVRADGSRVPIRILTPKGRAAEATIALKKAAAILRLEEDYFGINYPYAKLDLVAVPDFAAGAMENAGLITYRDNLLLFTEKTLTQGRLRSYIGIHAHELAHMWFGDLVTMRWWDDLWLNEAFATWFASKIKDQYRPQWQVKYDRLRGRSWVMGADSKAASRRMREPIVTRGDIDNAFDGITYTKGAAVLGMFEGYVGAESFRAGVQAYLKAHRWGSATYRNLLDAVEKASGKHGLGDAMATFLDQPGVPHLRFGKTQCIGNKATVSVEQSRWRPIGGGELSEGQWHVPFCIRTLGDQRETCHLLTQKRMTFQIPSCQPILPNSDGNGYFVWSIPAPELATLGQRVGTLKEYDQMNVMSNLQKLYESGHLDPVALATLGTSLIGSTSRRIQLGALNMIGRLRGLVEDKQIESWHRYRAALVKGLSNLDVWAGTPEDSRSLWGLRRAVLGIRGNAGHEESIISAARKAVEAFLSKAAFSKEVMGTAMAIFAEHGTRPDLHTLVKALKLEEETYRRRILLRGITRFRFEGVIDELFTLLNDPQTKANERGGLVWALSSDYRTRKTAWAWLREHFEAIRGVLPRGRAKRLPFFPTAACSQSIHGEMTSFFKPYLSGANRIQGLARHYTNAEYGLRACITLRKKYGKAIDRLLEPYQKAP
jgi:alanyl aminopeptidase